MKKIFSILFAMLACGSSMTFAMDGTFDRESEVQNYLQIIATKTNGEMTEVAKKIFSSGISDARLAKALHERLVNGYGTLAPPPGAANLPAGAAFALRGVDNEYATWIFRALISTGVTGYEATFRQLTKSSKQGGVKSDKVRLHILHESDEVEWHRKKNELMASRKFHQVGGDEHVSQLMNLIAGDDVSYRDFAINRIAVEKISDARICKFLEEKVADYAERAEGVARGGMSNGNENRFISQSVKLLGLSGDIQYRAVLEKVMASGAPSAVKKYTAAAIDRLK